MSDPDSTERPPESSHPPREGGKAAWGVVAAFFVILMCTSGLAFYNLMVFLHALTHEGIIGLGVVSVAIGFFFVVNGVAGLGVSSLLERYSARSVIAVGSVVGGGSLGLLGRVSDSRELFLVFGVFGLGFAATSLIPAMTVVTRWFHQRRSVAVSIVSTGLSLGGILITPLCARWIEHHGIAAVTPWIGLAYVVGVLPLALFFVRDRPPEAVAANRKGGVSDTPLPGVPYRQAISSRYFVWLGVAYIAIMLAQVGVLQHLYNAVALRVDTEFGRRIIQVLAGSSVVGRFSGGFLLLRLPIRPFTALLVAGQGVALASLAVASSELAITASVVLFGLTVGNLLMLQPLLLADAFGMRDYGHIYSTSQLVTTVGYATGPGLIAAVAGATEVGATARYEPAFLLAAAASGVAFVSLAIAGRPRAPS